MKTTSKLFLAIGLGIIIFFFVNSHENPEPYQNNNYVSTIDTITDPVPLTSKIPSVMVKGKDRSRPIQLKELAVSTKIVGTIAITTMDMLFYNDSNRILSGELYFPLNEGQTVSRFALDVNGKLREGVVVEKAKGRVVFEKMVRRGIDPGLVELTKGNNFKTRIYPIPAKGTKRVVVSYEQELINNKQSIFYQLPLFFKEKVEQFSLDMEVLGQAIPQIQKGKLSNFEFKNWEESYRASFQQKDFIASQELVINIPQKEKAINLITEKAKNGDHYFYANIHPKLYKEEKKIPSSICLIWDVSQSGLNRDLEKEIQVLSGYYKRFPQTQFRLVTFANEVLLNKTYSNWTDLKNALSHLNYDGATQLGKLSLENFKEEEFILVSDAVHTLGNSEMNLPAKPVHIINSSAGSNYALQKFITNSTGGQTINLSAMTVEQAVEQFSQVEYQFISSEIIGGEFIELYPKIPAGVTSDFSIAGILKSNRGRLKLNFGFGNKIIWSKEITINPNESYISKGIASRVWAEKKLEDMNVHYEENKEEIAALGKAFSIVTKNTSLIVLDNVMDYVEHEIVPPSELLSAYNEIVNNKLNLRRSQETNKINRVRANWQQRVDWWNKVFTVQEKKKYAWTETSGDVVTTDNLEVQEMPNSTQSPVPPSPRRAQLEMVEDEDQAQYEIVEDEVQYDMIEAEVEEEMLMEERTVIFSNAQNLRRQSSESNLNSGNSMVDSDKNQSLQANAMKKHITIKEWNPDNANFKKLTAEEAGNCYKTYLELKKEIENQPTFYTDAAKVLMKKGRKKEALRVISNLAEMELENHELLKVLANTLMEWKEIDLAVSVYKEILLQREEEPQSYRDLGLALHKQGKDQEAIEMLYQVIEKDWNNRFPQIENIVLGEINTIVANSKTKLDTDFMDSKLIDNLPVDVRIVIDWDADNVDIDLWVTDPRGEKCFYSHPDTKIGGHISRDFTRGYGPEEFMVKKAIKGKYKIEINYYGTSQQRIAGPPTITAKLVTNYGKADEKEETIILRLKKNKEVVFIGEMEVTNS